MLIEEDLLELSDGAKITELSHELCSLMPHASIGMQFGPWLGKTLLASPLVEELYADDDQLAQMLRKVI